MTGDEALNRIIQAQSRRIERQLQPPETRAYSGGEGKVQPLGANNAYRAPIQANTGLPSGSRVQYTQGVVAATPRTAQGGNSRRVEDRIAKLQTLPSPRTVEGDPTSLGTRARFPNEQVFDSTSGTTFEWDSSVPGWVAKSQTLQGLSAEPTATIYLDGAIAADNTGKTYTGNLATQEWTQSIGSGGVISVADDPNTLGTPLADNTLVVNTQTGGLYYSTGVIWQDAGTTPSSGGGTQRLIMRGVSPGGISVPSGGNSGFVDWAAAGFTVVRDDSNFWSSGDPTRFVVPEAGAYRLSLNAGFNNSHSANILWRCNAFNSGSDSVENEILVPPGLSYNATLEIVRVHTAPGSWRPVFFHTSPNTETISHTNVSYLIFEKL